ncbi:MAG: DUF402 domain-containing protein [Thermoactinomyces sp.]
MIPKKGDEIRIESLKYGNLIHRVWKKSVILQPGEHLILANYNAKVVEKNGVEWNFPGLAICLFSKRDWFHTVILYDDQFQLKEYYCNIASPYWWDEERNTLVYIDYDWDLIVKPNFQYQWVDGEEFEANRLIYGYPQTVVANVNRAKKELEDKVLRQEEPFTPDFAPFWYHQYLMLKTEAG